MEGAINETLKNGQDSYPLPEGYDAVYVSDGFRFEKDHFLVNQNYKDYFDYIMLPEGLIRDRVERLAQKIYKDYI